MKLKKCGIQWTSSCSLCADSDKVTANLQNLLVLLIDDDNSVLTWEGTLMNHLFSTRCCSEAILQYLPAFGWYQNMEQSRRFHVRHGSGMVHGLHEFRGKSIQDATDLLFLISNRIRAPHETGVYYRMNLFQGHTHGRVLKDSVPTLEDPQSTQESHFQEQQNGKMRCPPWSIWW